jgi:integrase/recombinase XerD
MKNADYLEAFADHLIEEEKSQGTINGYVSDIKGFLTYIKKDITKVTKQDLTSYKNHLKKRVMKTEWITNEKGKQIKVEHTMKTPSINRHLVSIKRFIDFINESFQMEITARVKQDKVQKQYALKDEELLTLEEYQNILKEAEKAGDIRAKTLLETMYYTGMRVSEALQLRVDHVEKGLQVIHDIKGKGSKYRPIFISDKLQEALKAYLSIREQPYASNTKALFVGERGPITRQTAHNLIKKYAEQAGIEASKAHVHNLRHLFCLSLAAKGFPIQDIAKYAGHSSIEITRRYVEKPESHYIQGINLL